MRAGQRRNDHEIDLMGGHLSSHIRVEGGGAAEEAEEDLARAADDNLHAISSVVHTSPRASARFNRATSRGSRRDSKITGARKTAARQRPLIVRTGLFCTTITGRNCGSCRNDDD